MAAIRVADPFLADRLGAMLDGGADVVVTDAIPVEMPDAPVIMLTREADALDALRLGVRGVLRPTASEAELRAAVEAVARGLIVLDPAAADLFTEPLEPETALTPREIEVLGLLAEGASNKTIARRLGISFRTAKFHVAAILAKLGARSRADAVAHGIRLGLVLL